MSKLVRRIEALAPEKAEAYGGKAASLAALARAGFPIPAAYAISADAFRDHVARATGSVAIVRDILRGTATAPLESLAEAVRSEPLAAQLRVELEGALEALSPGGAYGIAVRSSATFEDVATTSAAGLLRTELGVRTLQGLEDAVRACFASVFEARVIDYIGRALLEDAAIGVVVQVLVAADVAGVLFTMNPITGDPDEVVINATLGLGTSVVDGRGSPDTVRVDKGSGFVQDRVIGTKSTEVRFEDGKLTTVPVSPARAIAPSLDSRSIERLTDLARRLERHAGGPRDIEFAIRGGEVYVLQARPITSVRTHGARRPRRKRSQADERARIVWSNVNVGEALPGVATPLTWSVLSRFSEIGFRRAFAALGCSVPRDAELFGCFRGRIYLNLSELVSIASQVPGFRPDVLAGFAGGVGFETLAQSLEPRGRVGFLARLPLTIARTARENASFADRLSEFEAFFESEHARFHLLDLRILTPRALSDTLADVETLLDRAGSVMLTCYGNLLSTTLVLRAVLRLTDGDRADELVRGLTSGLADLESAAPATSLFHIAEMARAEPAAREAILQGSARTLAVHDLPDGPTRRALERFMEAHGHRGPREAELSSPRWREDPSLLFTMIRLQLGGTGPSPIESEEKQRESRATLEEALAAKLPPVARAAVRHLLALVQRFVRLRERLRARVTEVLGFYRSIALDASARMMSRDPDFGADGAFFLSFEELHRMLRGESRLALGLVRARRLQYERDRALPAPPDTFVGHPPQIDEAPASEVLRGVAVSGGVAQGIARVLTDPAQAVDFQRDEILVVAYADVGWSPLFIPARALVADVGGALSHAAIVAREYGLPAVMGVKVGTRTLRTGDRISVDGDAGIVRVIERAIERVAADSASPTP